MTKLPATFQDWDAIASLLPDNRQETAKSTGAFTRSRLFASCDQLLRMICLYAWADTSLKVTVADANAANFMTISAVALHSRLKKIAPWLETLILHLFSQKVKPAVLSKLPYQILLVDTTGISLMNSKGTDYRIHAKYNLLSHEFVELNLTTFSVGETFKNFTFSENDLVIADRGLAHRPGIVHIHKAKAKVIVRLTRTNLPLQTPDKVKFEIVDALKRLKAGEVGDWAVQTIAEGDLVSVPGRMIACRRKPKEIENAIRALKKENKNPSAEALLGCEYFFVFTTLSVEEANGKFVLDLYRFRWQIEMAFKLIKSQLQIDHVRAFRPDVVRSYLLCKILGVLLMEDFTSRWVSLHPVDFDSDFPISKWRLWASLQRVLIHALGISATLTDWVANSALKVGMYRDTSRKRKKQDLSVLFDVTREPANA